MSDFQPFLVNTRTACRLLGVGRTTLFKHLKSGVLARRKIGRFTGVTMESVKRLAGEGDV
ncbi:DNA-binding protein [Novosphingobium sp. UBA1939]|uniref:DNA-binding protein n=1 Tax=Novosphingobium sp. UBA1939 TaxID=1946982 RepID=UPI0025F55C3D|nr:DNA-binding protein [Novosphingobium sp. UBA1939]